MVMGERDVQMVGATSVTDRLELLRSVPLLAELGEALVARIATEVETVSLPAGHWLFRAGEEAQTAYVIASGRIEVLRGEPEEVVIAELRRGAAVGELALLRGGTRAASARARRDSTLISLRRDHFESLLLAAPQFALALTRAIADQLATTVPASTASQPPRTMALVSLDGRVPLRAAADALVRGLRRGEVMTALDSRPEEWSRQLGQAERRHDRVVLVAHESGPEHPWTCFCLGEADLVVALTGDSANPAWNAQAAALRDCELVFVDASLNVAVADRLRPRRVRAVSGLEGVAVAMGELGRRLCGRAVSIVLSGGGARALAHLGVVETLLEAGVPMDEIGGVSLGAIVGALFAHGASPEEAYGHAVRAFVDRNPTNDYTLPLVSLIRGRKTSAMLHEHFAGARIEELSIPFFCTSSDLLKRRRIVHRTGPVADALLASVSIPGVFPPVRDPRGRLLVDGGVIDNLPVGAILDSPRVIAVDVTGTVTPERSNATPGPLGRLNERLRARITGAGAHQPSLSETIVRCMTLASADSVAAAHRHADLVITPEVSGVGLLDWQRLPGARRIGIAAAERALAEHPDLVAEMTAR